MRRTCTPPSARSPTVCAPSSASIGKCRGGDTEAGKKRDSQADPDIGVKISARRDLAAELPVRWPVLAGNRQIFGDRQELFPTRPYHGTFRPAALLRDGDTARGISVKSRSTAPLEFQLD